MSQESFICMDCHREVELNMQGRCGQCNSDSVDSAAKPTPLQRVHKMEFSACGIRAAS